MLVMNGTAEYTNDDGFKEKRRRYPFNMFSLNENIDSCIEEIANFLGDRGWNEINIKRKEFVSNEANIENDLLREAFEDAKKNKYSVVIYSEPVDEAMKL
jgi:hypothetical protein